MPYTFMPLLQRRIIATSLCMLALSGCSQPTTPPASTSMRIHAKAIAQTDWFPTSQAAETRPWPDGKTSTAPTLASPQGTHVVAFANDLHHPRWLYALPNGDILVAEALPQPHSETFSLKQWISRQWAPDAAASSDRRHQITLLRDEDGDGIADQRHMFIKDIPAPAGIALIDDTLYVASANRLLKFAYEPGQVSITQAPEAVNQTMLASPRAPDKSESQKLSPQPIPGTPMDILANLINTTSQATEESVSAGRPVTDVTATGVKVTGLATTVLRDKNGHLLVADDAGNAIWQVKANRKVAQK